MLQTQPFPLRYTQPLQMASTIPSSQMLNCTLKLSFPNASVASLFHAAREVKVTGQLRQKLEADSAAFRENFCTR